MPYAPDPTFFVQVSGDVYGPYPLGRMHQFIDEGRIRSRSLVSSAPEGPFTRAEATPLLSSRLSTSSERPALPAPTRSAARPERVFEQNAAQSNAHTRSVFVMLDGAADLAARLDHVLSAYGEIAPATDAAWFVQTDLSVDALRNRLARELDGMAALILIDMTDNHAILHNVDPARDFAVRRLREDVSPTRT